MFLSVQSPTEVGRCTFRLQKLVDVLSRSILSARLRVPLIVATQGTTGIHVAAERLAFTAGFEAVLEDGEKSLDAPLSYSDTLPLVPSSIFTKDGPIPTPNIRYRLYQMDTSEKYRCFRYWHVTCPRFVS